MKMGLQFGLERSNFCIKRQFRWMFTIPNVCGDESPGANALPPEKSARPTISFKEMSVKHLIEDYVYPAKPEWKPIQITLYDLKRDSHPVFNWVKQIYDPVAGQFYEPLRRAFIQECSLSMLSGCGEVIERWIYEDCWPNDVNFGSLDMGGNGYMTVDFRLNYARAYIETTPAPLQNVQLPPLGGLV